MEVNDRVNKILSNFSISALNLMQEAAYDAISTEKDIVLKAPTGSGKTLGFFLPILDELNNDINQVQCLVLAPSRELCIQIEQVWKKMSTGLKVNCCYGGHNMAIEVQNLKTPPVVLIGTPGRIADHMRRKTFSWDDINILILDEFDKSLDLGFYDEMSYIVGKLRKLHKRILVSATDTIEIPDFIRLKNPKVLDFSTEETTGEGLSMKMVLSESKDKIDSLFNLLCYLGAESTLIFCNHREAAERVSQLLKEKGIENSFFHGGMEQIDRERTLIRFRNGSISFLVTTDLASRGLDIPEVKNVVHYHLPSTADAFTHRNGRTARMHATGMAFIILYKEEILPKYLPEPPEELILPMNLKLPKTPDWTTLYISGGKKDKLNKVDIVGFLCTKGKLAKEDIGLIEVKDFLSFVAIKKLKADKVLKLIQHEKMKTKKFKIELAK